MAGGKQRGSPAWWNHQAINRRSLRKGTKAKGRLRSITIPKMRQKAQNMHTYMSPQLKCGCYKARGNMHFTSTSRAYSPCLAISRHPVNRHLLNKLKQSRSTFCSVSNSFIYSVCVPTHRFTLHGKKCSQNKFKTRRQDTAVVSSTGSNPSTTREQLGGCGQLPNLPALQLFSTKWEWQWYWPLQSSCEMRMGPRMRSAASLLQGRSYTNI